jgi:hypothetical protein
MPKKTLTVALPAPASRERPLGSTTLSYEEDARAALDINQCPDPAFTRVQLRVKRGDVDIQRLVVVYKNSQKEELSVATKIRHGNRSSWLDLQGNRRCLQKIRIVGDTDDRSRQKALVEFWGKY